MAVSGLCVTHGAGDVLHEIDLSVSAGDSVAIVGTSGSGKSTLLHALAGLVAIRSGAVHVAGHDLAALSEEARSRLRRERLGFVFQFGELVPELSLGENVALPLRLLGEHRRVAAGRARDLLGELGIGDLAGRRPGEVSGGQAQRAAIARAVIHRPAVVLADEPTGALDSHHAEAVLDLLFDLVADHGASLVLVTHEAAVAARASTSVHIVDGRRVAATGEVAPREGDRAAP